MNCEHCGTETDDQPGLKLEKAVRIAHTAERCRDLLKAMLADDDRVDVAWIHFEVLAEEEPVASGVQDGAGADDHGVEGTRRAGCASGPRQSAYRVSPESAVRCIPAAFAQQPSHR